MGIPREGESGGKLTPNCFQSFDCFDPLRFYPKKVDVNCATRRPEDGEMRLMNSLTMVAMMIMIMIMIIMDKL